MTSQMIAAPRVEAVAERHRQAERALWGHYGLEPAERFVEVSGVRLRLLEVGSGEPVVFVHGTGGPGAWAALVREQHGCRCLLLDRPGWGLSAPVDYSGREYKTLIAGLLGGVLDALGIDRAHAAGASIGDNRALALAARDPARTGRVVLLGGGPLVPEIRLPTFIRLLASPLGRIMVRLPQKEKMVRSQLRGLGHGATPGASRTSSSPGASP